MDWKLYEENKKQKEETEKYQVLCRVLGVIILVICFLWYRSDSGRMKWVNKLQEEIEEKEAEIEELKSEIEFWKEESGS